MEYSIAKGFGNLGIAILVYASLYYGVRWIFLWLKRHQHQGKIVATLQKFLPHLRKSHPYAALTLLPLMAIHGYVIWSVRGATAKVMVGAALLSVIFLMAIAGWLLKKHPSDMGLRRWHRSGMFLVWLLLILHETTKRSLPF